MNMLSVSPLSTRAFDAEIACALGDINAAIIVQQLYYWMGKEGVGITINKVKYIYNSFNDWVKQFPWLSVWQFRKAMKLLRDLEIVEVIRYKSRQWNQTNYYTLNSDQLRWHCRDRLYQLLNPKTSESIENSDLRDTTDREVKNQQIEVRDNKLSYIESKKTIQKETAKTEDESFRRSLTTEENIAAVSLKTNLKEENYPYGQINTFFREVRCFNAPK